MVAKKFKVIVILAGAFFIIYGIYCNETYDWSDDRFGFLMFPIGSLIIIASFFSPQKPRWTLVIILSFFIPIFFFIELMTGVKALLLNTNTELVKGVVIDEVYNKSFKGIKSSWTFHYRFNLNGQKFLNKETCNSDSYSIGDTVTIKYSKWFHHVNRIDKK
jgi:hypothetical protein